MAKEDVKQAISETIVSNGKKAITAESLSNVLNMMVDEGGSGSGALMIKVGDAVVDGNPVLSAADREHNREIMDKVREAVKRGEAMPSLSIDCTNLVMGEEGVDLSLVLEALRVESGVFIAYYVSGALLQAEIGYSELLYGAGFAGILPFILLPDGSLIFED